MAFYHYHAYGLTIASALELPEFTPNSGKNVDVTIHLHAPQQPALEWEGRNWFFAVNRQEALLFFRGVGTFELHQGEQIKVTPEPAGDFRLLQLYLIGTVFAVLLYQRSLFILHGSAIVDAQGHALIFVGESGAGKSTLAATWAVSGRKLLSDDVAPIDPCTQTIFPGYPRIKISRDMAAALHIPQTNLSTIHPDEEKRYFCPRSHQETPVRIAAIFVLQSGTTWHADQLTPAAAMMEMVRHSIPGRLLHRPGDELHFRQCSAVARHIPIFSLQGITSQPPATLQRKIQRLLSLPRRTRSSS